ncbi:MAG: hypothetical protein WC655_00835, partial [Candidatus Hydrogenedentales bacterium]
MSREKLYVATLVIACVACCANAQDLPDPEKPGPYPVGVTTMQLLDHSRTDLVSKAPRSLLTEVWYPATDESRDLPKNRLLDYYLGGKNLAYLFAMGAAFGAD